MRIARVGRLLPCLVAIVMAAGCGVPAGSGSVQPAGSGPAAASPSGTPQPASGTASGAAATGAAVVTGAPAAKAAFLSHVFTDVRDGKQFTLGDFAGKQVLVLGMAVW